MQKLKNVLHKRSGSTSNAAATNASGNVEVPAGEGTHFQQSRTMGNTIEPGTAQAPPAQGDQGLHVAGGSGAGDVGTDASVKSGVPGLSKAQTRDDNQTVAGDGGAEPAITSTQAAAPTAQGSQPDSAAPATAATIDPVGIGADGGAAQFEAAAQRDAVPAAIDTEPVDDQPAYLAPGQIGTYRAGGQAPSRSHFAHTTSTNAAPSVGTAKVTIVSQTLESDTTTGHGAEGAAKNSYASAYDQPSTGAQTASHNSVPDIANLGIKLDSGVPITDYAAAEEKPSLPVGGIPVDHFQTNIADPAPVPAIAAPLESEKHGDIGAVPSTQVHTGPSPLDGQSQPAAVPPAAPAAAPDRGAPAEPAQKEHHLGRDAALAGAGGAAAYGVGHHVAQHDYAPSKGQVGGSEGVPATGLTQAPQDAAIPAPVQQTQAPDPAPVLPTETHAAPAEIQQIEPPVAAPYTAAAPSAKAPPAAAATTTDTPSHIEEALIAGAAPVNAEPPSHITETPEAVPAAVATNTSGEPPKEKAAGETKAAAILGIPSETPKEPIGGGIKAAAVLGIPSEEPKEPNAGKLSDVGANEMLGEAPKRQEDNATDQTNWPLAEAAGAGPAPAVEDEKADAPLQTQNDTRDKDHDRKHVEEAAVAGTGAVAGATAVHEIAQHDQQTPTKESQGLQKRQSKKLTKGDKKRDSDGEKKPGLLDKLIHRDRKDKNDDTREAAAAAAAAAPEGAAIAESHHNKQDEKPAEIAAPVAAQATEPAPAEQPARKAETTEQENQEEIKKRLTEAGIIPKPHKKHHEPKEGEKAAGSAAVAAALKEGEKKDRADVAAPAEAAAPAAATEVEEAKADTAAPTGAAAATPLEPPSEPAKQHAEPTQITDETHKPMKEAEPTRQAETSPDPAKSISSSTQQQRNRSDSAAVGKAPHTTHEAYQTGEGKNRLHKEPPAKVLEQRGLQ